MYQKQELARLVHAVSQRIARFLEPLGLVERDAEINYLLLDDIDDDPMLQLLGGSVSYRIAVARNRLPGYLMSDENQGSRKIGTGQFQPAAKMNSRC